MIEKITIKFGTELKPTQYNWKSQLYKIQSNLTLNSQQNIIENYNIPDFINI